MDKEMRERFKEAERYADMQLDQQAKRPGITGTLARAARSAREQVKSDGIFPRLNEHGEYRYTLEQGLKAAAYSREDIAAVFILQKTILERLQTLRRIGMICLLVLIFVAIRVSVI